MCEVESQVRLGDLEKTWLKNTEREKIKENEKMKKILKAGVGEKERERERV